MSLATAHTLFRAQPHPHVMKHLLQGGRRAFMAQGLQLVALCCNSDAPGSTSFAVTGMGRCLGCNALTLTCALGTHASGIKPGILFRSASRERALPRVRHATCCPSCIGCCSSDAPHSMRLAVNSMGRCRACHAMALTCALGMHVTLVYCSARTEPGYVTVDRPGDG